MARIIHFEMPIDDPERAVKFYKEVFDWEIEKWEGPVDYWLITTGKEDEQGINGALTRRENLKTVTNTVEVKDADIYAKKIEEKGGKLKTPKMTIPGIGYMYYCEDTEGNVFGIMQSDMNAK